MISSSENRVSYNGNGTATEFAYQFKILEKSDIKVMRVDVDGNTEILTKDYYVDAEKNVVIYPGYAPGAEIPESERPPVLPSGWHLVLYREVPITQFSRLPEIWPFNVIEAMADKLTIICQQLKDAISRCLKINESSDKNIDTTIPWEAGKTFRVSDDGTHLESTEDPGKVYEASKGFAEAAATSATNAIAANKEAQQANEEVKQIYNNGMLTPISDLAGSIGTELKRWGTIFANKVFASNLPLMYNSVSDMKSDRKLKAGMTACTLGYYSPNDGGAGTYIIRAKQDDVDDGGSVHEVGSKLVAELVVENGTVNVKQFGAKGDGVSDDSKLLQAASKCAHKILVTDVIKVSTLKLENIDIVNKETIYITGVLEISNCCINGGKVLLNKSTSPLFPTIVAKASTIKNVIFDDDANNKNIVDYNSQCAINTVSGVNYILNCVFEPVARFDILESSLASTFIDKCIFKSHDVANVTGLNSCGIKASNTNYGYNSIEEANADLTNSGSQNNKITNCFFGSHGDNCIDFFAGMAYSTIENCTFYNKNNAILEIKNMQRTNIGSSDTSVNNIRFTSDITISNCYLYAENYVAIEIKNTSEDTSASIPVKNIIFSNCTIKSDLQCVKIASFAEENVIEVYFENCLFNVTHNSNSNSCITIESYSNEVVFNGCKLEGGYYGIRIYSGTLTYRNGEMLSKFANIYTSNGYLNKIIVGTSKLTSTNNILSTDNEGTEVYVSSSHCTADATCINTLARIYAKNSQFISNNGYAVLIAKTAKAQNCYFSHNITYKENANNRYTFINCIFNTTITTTTNYILDFYGFNCYISKVMPEIYLSKMQGCSLNAAQTGDTSNNYVRLK